MKRVLTTLTMATIVCIGLIPTTAPTIAASRETAMGIAIVAPKKSFTMSATRSVTMTVNVSGVRLDLRHIGKKDVPGSGHIQIYLDRIPSDAYRRVDTAHLVVVVGSPRFSFQVSKTWVRENRGHHHLILALAHNNNVLYHAMTARIGVTVK